MNNNQSNNDPQISFGSSSKPRRKRLLGIYLLISGILIVLNVVPWTNRPPETTWNDFSQQMLLQNHVQKLVVVNNEEVEIFIKPEVLIRAPEYAQLARVIDLESAGKRPQYTLRIGSVATFEQQLDEIQRDIEPSKRIAVAYETRKSMGGVLSWGVPIFVLLVIGIIIGRATRR